MTARSGRVETSVLIVGGGPVGLAAAVELGSRGVECLLVERRDSSINHPKMNQISVRTMEICRRWGIAPKVRDLSIPDDFPRNYTFATAIANGYELGRCEFPARKDVKPVHSPEALQRCSQLWFDPALREHALSFPSVSVRYRTQLERHVQTADGVECVLTDLPSGRTFEVAAKYLVACDGVTSAVREREEIALEGDGALSFNVNVFFRSRARDVLFAKGPAVMQWVFTERGLAADIVAIDTKELWRCAIMRLPPGTELTLAQAADHVRAAVGVDFGFEIESVLPWTRRSVVAERFTKGRVLLAGDSVHQMSPTGGYGMNTGISEAVDLGWKLAAVLQGWGGAHLLDSYDVERRPIAHQFVAEGGRNFRQLLKLPMGPDIIAPGPAGDAFRQKWRDTFAALQMDREYDSDGLVLGYRYEGSPIIVSEAEAEPPLDVMQYRPSSRPGHRAPHVFLADGRSTLDLFGAGFKLLVFDQALDAPNLRAAAAARRVPLAMENISERHAAELYEAPLVLVRPDGHVAWRGDRDPSEAAGIIERIRGAERPETE